MKDSLDFGGMRRVVLSHHLSDALQGDVSSHAFLGGTARTLLGSGRLQSRDVRRTRGRESLQRRLEIELDVPTLLSDAVAFEIGEVRPIAAQQLLDPRTVTFDLEIGKMPRLLHRREETVDATTKSIDRNGREFLS